MSHHKAFNLTKSKNAHFSATELSSIFSTFWQIIALLVKLKRRMANHRAKRKIHHPAINERIENNMKATGIVRRIDDLGRVVIPKEIRRTMRIREGDPLDENIDRVRLGRVLSGG